MYKHIRKIFTVFALAMVVVFVMRVSAGAWSVVNWGMLAVAAVVCLLVFRCFVFIFNYSYALACLLNGLLIAGAVQTPAAFVLGLAIAAYGLRLFVFTWQRTHSASYAPRVAHVRQESAKLPPPVKAVLWLQCTFLYTFHTLGIYMAARQGPLSDSVLIGAAIILAGIVIEALADAQKQAAKRERPDTFVTTGLFARWRHPNYIGEIIVQLGLLIAGVAAVVPTWGNLVAVSAAPLYIVLLMVSECLRADDQMALRYGDQDAFRRYRERSGTFLPRF